MKLRESFIIIMLLILSSTFLFLIEAPAANVDLDFYTEPAFQLSKTGVIKAPALQYCDLSYVDGCYNYPPGHSMVLGGWLKLFGLSAPSLRGFTLACHAITLLALWAVLRVRLGFGIIVSALGNAPFFLVFTHGRPDQTSMMFGVLGWLLCPGRVGPAGLLLGLALFCSPAMGLATAIPAGVAVIAATRRLGPALALTASTIGTLACCLGTVLAWQNAWHLAAVQFSTNAAIRGSEINRFPDLTTVYAVRFCLVPLVLLTLVPAGVVLARWFRGGNSGPPSAPITAIAYLASCFCLFLLVKAYLLLWFHYLLPGRPAVLAAFFSGTTNRVGRLLAGLVAIGLLVTSADFTKDVVLYSALGSTRPETPPRLPETALVAVDSFYYPLLRNSYETISYEWIKSEYWRRYLQRSASDPWFASRYGNRRPATPHYVVLSATTIERFGPPDASQYELLTGASAGSRLGLFGMSTSTLETPYRLSVYRLRRRSAGSAR